MKFRNLKNQNKNIMKKISAFTLIELIIGMVIFIIFLGIVTNSYISIVRGFNKENTERKVYAEIRDFIDLLNQEVRLSSIDYDCYSTQSNFPDLVHDVSNCPRDNSISSNDKLVLVHKDNLELNEFSFDVDKANIMKQTWFSTKGVTGWQPEVAQPLFTDDVKVTKLSMEIFPKVNPYLADSSVYANSATQFQPVVFVNLVASYTDAQKNEHKINFQTAISSRVYNR